MQDWLKQQKKNLGTLTNLAIGVGLASGWLIILQAGLLAYVVNAVAIENAHLDDVWLPLAGIAVLMLIRALLTWLSQQIAFQSAIRIKTGVRQQILDHLRLVSPVTLYGERSGEFANAALDSVEALESYYANYLPAMSLMVWLPLSIVAFIFPFDWISGLILLATAPLIPVFMILIGKGAEKLNQKQWRQLAWMSAYFLDILQGLSTLKLFNASRREAELVAQVSDDYRRSTMKVLRVAFLSSLVLEFLATMSIALVAVLIGFRLLWGEIDFQYGFFILLLAPEFYLPLRSMGQHYHARMEAIGAAERIVEVLELPIQDQSRKTETLDKQQAIAIRFEQLSYDYAENKTALKQIDAHIPANATLAIVGESGAGKSTLVNLLLGFLEAEQGKISLNDCNISHLKSDNLAQLISWVPQRPRLFYGTVAENLRLADPNASLDAMRDATQKAGALNFIEALPKGFDTLIGEQGTRLSGGQVQRLALSRAFLKNAPIVILDEPTAHLDQESESIVQQALEQLKQQHTVIIIAHRLHTITHADEIWVLNKGELAEQGNYESLMQTGKLFKQLMNA